LNRQGFEGPLGQGLRRPFGRKPAGSGTCTNKTNIVSRLGNISVYGTGNSGMAVQYLGLGKDMWHLIIEKIQVVLLVLNGHLKLLT
jgi:hypothetical protein